MTNHSKRGRIEIRPLGSSYWSKSWMLDTITLPPGYTFIAEVTHSGDQGHLVRTASGNFAVRLVYGAFKSVDQRKVAAALAEQRIDLDNPAPPQTEQAVADELAGLLKEWRNGIQPPISLDLAEQMLDIPRRTLEGIEQGRGFRYPKLLVLALLAFKGQPPCS